MEFKRMTLETLVLEVADPEVEIMRQDLAKKAKSVLGYGLFEKHLREKAERKNIDSLVHALVELEKEPLDTKEVEVYQKSQRKSMNWKAFLDLPWYAKLLMLWNKMFEKLLGFPIQKNENRIFGGFFVSGFVGLASEIAALLEHNWLIAIIVSPFALFFVSFFCILPFIRVVTKKEIKIKEWGWKPLTFKECEEQKIEIPDFALDTAIRVKERVPDAQVYIEALMSTERLLGDPFLVVQHGGQKFYLEVWEESKFERRKTV